MTEPRWPIAFTVEHGKCRELAVALRASDPAYTDGAPLRAVPTFPVAANHWGWSNARVLESLGCDVTRVMHGSEEYEYPNGPLLEGQRLAGEMRLIRRETKRSRSGRELTTFEFETELVDEVSGELAARIRRTVLEVAA